MTPLAPDNQHALRRQAWAFGRDLRDRLVDDYRREYGIAIPPPPAFIMDELLTDFLDVTLRFDPLRLDRFAQTEWLDGRVVVTINSLTHEIPGVKDPQGVQNVAKGHEAVHVVRDIKALQAEQGNRFPGFDVPLKIVCYRARRPGSDFDRREFWAEEAGRAAVVSHRALGRSAAFQALMKLEPGSMRANGEAWRLLYKASRDIGVNSRALVTQLRLEGLIDVSKEDGRNVLRVQPSLFDWVTAP